MIKAQELRIGNTVYNHNLKTGQREIINVDLDDLGVAELLEPIPLTPELLEAVGVVYSPSTLICLALLKLAKP